MFHCVHVILIFMANKVPAVVQFVYSLKSLSLALSSSHKSLTIQHCQYRLTLDLKWQYDEYIYFIYFSQNNVQPVKGQKSKDARAESRDCE